jgi:2-polyprenyl-3-methyl-5-hydroxy-6-metoxy-1,4-benzoquinol methylase
MKPTPEDVRRLWEENARWWDATYGEGNDFQQTLIGPATEDLLAIRSGETILDIACGNGAFSRRMARLGAAVVGFDFSAAFIGCARARTTEHADRIDYHVLDATDREALLGLGERRFDAAVCTMAIMDVSDIEPLAEILPRLLVPGGRFVFSVLHPCFANNACRMSLEEETRNGRLVVTPAVKVIRYATPFASEGIGIRGQPVPQIYFHRPLHVLLGTFFSHGFAVDGLEEPHFDAGAEGRLPTSWEAFPEIPPVLCVRMRVV